MYFGRSFARILLFILGLSIALGTMFYVSSLFSKIAKEEREEVKLFAQALKNIGKRSDEELNIYWSVLQMNKNVPIFIFDEKGFLVQHTNAELKPEEFKLSQEALLRKKGINSDPIQLQIGKNSTQFIYYGYSSTLKMLRYIPFIQLFLIFLFVSLGYVLYRGIQQSYQNQIWAGFSKETAHQLGTPISSLMGWLQLLEQEQANPAYLSEINKDLGRLRVVSDRFSNIGSIPEKEAQNIVPLIEETITYIEARISKSVQLNFEKTNDIILANVNKELLNWVMENLIKNSVDAIVRRGKISILAQESNNKVYIDIVDTGKGIPPKLIKKVFQPGYSTKKRGWGLGLSLAKRIIKHYHNGRIFVKNTEIDKGTTFRIVLPKV